MATKLIGLPNYRVILSRVDTGSSYGVGTTICEFENIKNIGWAKYLNDVGECYFTIDQDDPKLSGIRPYMGTAHVKVLRQSGTGTWETVWRGILSEHEANSRDVIFHSYGYESVLFWLMTKWNQTWTNATIGTIATALWTYAKGLGNGQLGFVTTGTIQSPVTTTGGSTAITLPSYKAYLKRLLFAFKELVAVAASDTANTCYFELVHSRTETDNAVTFNLWKDRSTDRTLVLKYGVNVKDFADRYAPILTRNHVAGVGSGAHNLLFRYNKLTTGGSRGSIDFGLRMEPVYFTWVRDQQDLERVTRLRAARALRADMDLQLFMAPDALSPLGTAKAGYSLGDRFPVVIDRGVTQISKTMMMIGQQVTASRGAERVYPILLDRAGS